MTGALCLGSVETFENMGRNEGRRALFEIEDIRQSGILKYLAMCPQVRKVHRLPMWINCTGAVFRRACLKAYSSEN